MNITFFKAREIKQALAAIAIFALVLMAAQGIFVSVVQGAPAEKIDFCHAPSGDLNKAEKFLNQPATSWSPNGHADHNGDFLILDQDDEDLCDAIVAGTQCADQIDNDGDNFIDSDDPGCWTDPNDPLTYDPFDDNESDEAANVPPVITLVGSDPVNITVGDSYTDDGATANDAEDGDITSDIVVGGDTVDPNTTGTYIITYNVTDSDGAAAAEVTRTVNVNPEVTECDDGLDNDGDGLIDFPEDTGCDSAEDNDENTPPVITLVGSDPVDVIVDTSYTDDGATADDTEDGDITGDIVVGGDTVDISTIGTYVVTYDVTDSDGAAAAQVTRTVNVNPEVTECNDEIDNDGDGLIDFPEDTGCDSEADNDENTPPIITLVGSDPVNVTVGDPYTDDGATADDTEDGDITGDIVVGGDTVDTNATGTYIITYNVTDSDGAAAAEVTRTVNVNEEPPLPQCSDDIDNDDDGKVDFPNDPGCDSEQDDDETDDGGSTGGGGDVSCSISTDDPLVDDDDTFTLSWSSNGNVVNAFLDGGTINQSVNPNGSIDTQIDDDTTFILTVSADGSKDATCEVLVKERGGGGGGGGTRITDGGGGGGSEPSGQVLGESTSAPEPEVLGEQVTAVPTGAPAAGAGGAAGATAIPSAVALIMMLASALTLRATREDV